MANAFTIETAVAAGLLLTACSGAQPRRGAGEGEVAALADRYFDEVFFKYSPTRATRAGLHEYDTRLEDFSPAAIDAQVAALKDFETRFERLQMPGSPDAEADRELLLSDIRSNLLELTTIRRWEKDPDLYSGGITASAFVIMSRNFAPPDERLRSLVAREKQMPAMLEIARQNLKAPPRRYTEIALEQLPGILSFFEKDVPAAFRDAKDEATLREFAQWNGRVVSALRAYQQFLQTDLLPRSGGDYRIGAETYRKKLLWEEAVDLRSTGCWRSAWPTCAATSASSSAWPRSSPRTARRSRSSRTSAPTTRRPRSCCRRSATPSATCAGSSLAAAS